MDHGRRADLLRARPEPRADRGLPDPRGPRARLRILYPLLLAPAYAALRRPAGRVRRGEGHERARDVARRRPGVPARAARRGPLARACSPRRSRSPCPRWPTRHGDDREPLLPASSCSPGRSCSCSSGRPCTGGSCSWRSCSPPPWPPARRRSRSSPRPCSRRSCSRSSRGAARVAAPFAPLYGGTLGARACSCSAVSSRGAGRSPTSSARTATSGRAATTPGQVLRFWLWHVAELTSTSACVPFAALVVLLARARRLAAGLRRTSPRRSRSRASTLVVAAFASRFASDRVRTGTSSSSRRSS